MTNKTYSIYDLIELKEKVEKISSGFFKNGHPNRCLEVKDLNQEALIRVYAAFKKKSIIDIQEINEIAKNAIINALKHYRNMSTEEKPDRVPGLPPGLDYDESVLREINEVIETLPKKTKDIVRAASEEDVTITELARRMNISRQTVAKRLEEGKKTIVKKMKKKHPLM